MKFCVFAILSAAAGTLGASRPANLQSAASPSSCRIAKSVLPEVTNHQCQLLCTTHGVQSARFNRSCELPDSTSSSVAAKAAQQPSSSSSSSISVPSSSVNDKYVDDGKKSSSSSITSTETAEPAGLNSEASSPSTIPDVVGDPSDHSQAVHIIAATAGTLTIVGVIGSLAAYLRRELQGIGELKVMPGPGSPVFEIIDPADNEDPIFYS